MAADFEAANPGAWESSRCPGLGLCPARPMAPVPGVVIENPLAGG